MSIRGMPRILAALSTIAIVLSIAPAALAGGGPAVIAPRVTFALNGQLNSRGVPLNVSWPKGTPAGAAIARYQLEKSVDMGLWTSVKLRSSLTRSLTVRVKPWKVIQFRVRAIDRGNVTGAWALGDRLWLSAAQETDEELDLSANWQTISAAKAYGKRRAVTSMATESATFSFTGREVAWVAQVGPKRGGASATSSLGVSNVRLTRSRGSSRRIVFRASWPDDADRQLTITSTIAGKPVDIDALLVLADATTQTMIGAGDIAVCLADEEGHIDPTTSDAYKSAQLVEGIDGIVFTAGDNSQWNGTPEHFASCYEPTWGAFRQRTRPSPGNHDYKYPGAAAYYDYFGNSAGPAGRGWYAYDAGTWRVYSLNSECGRMSPCMAAQVQWLEADLAAEPHRCVLAYWHRARFSTAVHGNSIRVAQLFQVLYDHGVDLLVTGHDHSYQRFAKVNPSGNVDALRGVREIVAATGGAPLYRWKSDNPAVEVRNNVTHGVLRLDLAPGGYSWEFLPSDGTFSDSGTDSCH